MACWWQNIETLLEQRLRLSQDYNYSRHAEILLNELYFLLWVIYKSYIFLNVDVARSAIILHKICRLRILTVHLNGNNYGVTQSTKRDRDEIIYRRISLQAVCKHFNLKRSRHSHLCWANKPRTTLNHVPLNRFLKMPTRFLFFTSNQPH